MQKNTTTPTETPMRCRPGPKQRQPVRWTISAAAEDLEVVSRVTLRKWLRQSGIKPGPDGCYSTLQIVAACMSRYADEAMAERTNQARGDGWEWNRFNGWIAA